MIKNNFPNKSGNAEISQQYSQELESCFVYSFVFQLIVKKHLVAKGI